MSNRDLYLANSPGFTLLEVLVAIVVLALGLLGVAGLQMLSLNFNQTAVQRSLAVQQAYDLADRVRANVIGARTATNYAFGGTNYSTARTYSEPRPGCGNPSPPCTAAQMAALDRSMWSEKTQNVLPQGAGFSFGDAAQGYTVVVMWRERDETLGACPNPLWLTGTPPQDRPFIRCFWTRVLP